jgi:rubrerythrin
LAGQEFKFRVSPKGEISEVIELEQIHERIFKALGDTLKPDEKTKIKESMGSEALKSIIQNQFQKFPEFDVYKDSTWTFNSETTLSIFPIKNILSYKLKDLKTDKGIVIGVEATLGIEFLSKEEKQQGMLIKLTDEVAGGNGFVSVDLSKGCVVKKETTTNINMNLKLSAKGQSANSKQTLKTNLNVELL